MTITWRKSVNRLYSFLASAVYPFSISRTFEAHYSIMLSPSLPLATIDHLSESTLCCEQPKPEYCTNGFSSETESERNAHIIRKVILNIYDGTVDEIVHALNQDKSCCELQLTSYLVDGLLHKFGDDWKSALGFFQWANSRLGYKHTTFSCNRMVDLLGKMKQTDQMWDVVQEMRKEGLVTIDTVAKIMRRLVGAGRWKDAVKVFDDLGSMGFDKNTSAMNILLDTLCKEKKVEVAREVYLNLKAYVSPDAYTFNIFVNGWCSARKVDEAMWTIQEMKGCGLRPSTITYSTIILAHCNRFNFREAFDLLDEMVADGCPPNIVTYTTIMHSLARSGKSEDALNIVDKMKVTGCKPDTVFYNSLINILGRSGQVSKASHIFWGEMEMNGVIRNLSTYNTMISIFCHHGLEKDALDVLREMENSSCEPVLQTFFPFVKLCFRTGKVDDQLKKLLSDIVNKHHLSLDIDTFTLLIHGLCSVGKIDWAFLLFDEMINREILPRLRTMKILVSEAEQKNMDGAAERIKRLMKQFANPRTMIN